jgi:O-antigen ligase
MDFVSQLLQVAGSPVGLLLLIGVGGFVLTTKPAQRPLHWLLFAVFAFAASLAKFRDQFVEKPPPLAFPLDQIREVGRPLTILLLGLLLLLALKTKKGWRQKSFPAPLQMLFLLQGVLVFKVLLEGDLTFGLLSAITYCAAIFVVVRGPGRWLQDECNFRLGVGAIALAGALFLGACFYQFNIDPYPITFVHGLLLGTTGNPQHAATLLVATLPCFLFLLLMPDQKIWQRAIWVLLLLGALYALLLTGSRTGVLSALVGGAVFFMQGLSRLQKLALLIGLGLALIFFTADSSMATGAFDSVVPGKLASFDNTRAGVWQAQWNAFKQYPIFGAPLLGGRLGFGENSWLAVAASTGVIGLIPLALFAYQSFKFMARLYRIGERNSKYRLHCSTVVAGLSALLVGSIAEAYLLGLITFPLLAISTYLVLGQYIIDIDRLEAQTQATLIMPPHYLTETQADAASYHP